MKKANLKKLHTVWFHLYNVFELAILEMENKLEAARVKDGKEYRVVSYKRVTLFVGTVRNFDWWWIPEPTQVIKLYRT